MARQSGILFPANWFETAGSQRRWSRGVPTPAGTAIPIDDALSSVANNALSSLGVTSGGVINIAADNQLSSGWESDGRIEVTIEAQTWLFKPDNARCGRRSPSRSSVGYRRRC